MPISLPPEVPAYVRHADHVSNHVQVQGGSNWDFSRSAVATPIAALADPEPRKGIEPSQGYTANPALSDGAFVTAVKFSKASVTIPLNMQKVLRALPLAPTYALAGHAGTKEPKPELLARKRERAVISFLTKHGNHVTEAASTLAGTTKVMKDTDGARRVDIFVAY